MNAPRIPARLDRAELVRRAIEREVIRLHGAVCVLRVLRGSLDGLAWSCVTADLTRAMALGEPVRRSLVLACAHMSVAEVDHAVAYLASESGLGDDEWVTREASERTRETSSYETDARELRKVADARCGDPHGRAVRIEVELT